MCGVVGAITPGKTSSEIEARLARMSAVQAYRGPDGRGTAIGDGWGLGHVRLAIVDLENGGQPMWSADRTVALIGNHEIYNAPELRLELEEKGRVFRTRSDTEVVLVGYEEWGSGVFARLNGMFALAIVDVKEGRCLLARDPMGIKPLHVARTAEGLFFGSEIKALRTMPGVGKRPDLDAAHVFFNLRYLPGEQTLFEGVARVAPGTVYSYSLADARELSREVFWDWAKLRPDASLDFDSSSVKLGELFEASVRRHLIADVPVGAYLSGGIDSSLVATVAARSVPLLETFCAVFGEPTDEGSDSVFVADRIGSRHHILSLSGELNRYPEALEHTEEPKVNHLQGFLLAEAVAKKTKVVLSGLGGDELFAGYENNDVLYPMCVLNAKRPAERAEKERSSSLLQSFLGGASRDFYFQAADLGVNLGNPLRYYAILRNSFDHSPHLMKTLYAKPRPEWEGMTTRALEPYFDRDTDDLLSSFLRLEARTKLTNDFLLNEDRGSMAHGLETRTPFLDHELVRFAFSLPSSFSYSVGERKKILRRFAKGVLPEETLAKKKWGFSYDPVSLFRGELGRMAREILTRERVERFGFVSWEWVSSVLDASPGPRMRWHYFNLWVAMGMTLWHERFFGESEAR